MTDVLAELDSRRPRRPTREPGALTPGESLGTFYVSTIHDAFSLADAATTLGLDVRVESRWVPEPDEPGAFEREWTVEALEGNGDPEEEQ